MRGKSLVLLLTFITLSTSLGQERKDTVIKLLVFRDGEAREVALAIARATGLNVVVDSSFSGTVSLHLREVQAEEALTLLAQAVGGRFVKTEKGFLLTKQPAAPVVHVEGNAEKVTVNVQNAEAAEVLRQIAEKGQINLVLGTDLPTVRVTIHLRDVTPEEAVKEVAKAAGWDVQKDGKIFKVQRPAVPSVTSPPLPPSQPAQRPTSLPVAGRPEEREEEKTKSLEQPKTLPIPSLAKGKVTLEAVNVPLSQVIDEISRQTGVDVLVYGRTDEKVTVRLNEVPVEEALKIILAGTKYTVLRWEKGEDEGGKEKSSGSGSNPQSGRQRFLIGEWGDPTKWSSPTVASLLETKRLPLKYLKAEQVPQILSPAIPRDIVKVLADQNALLVTGPKEFLERVEKEIEQADRVTEQVIIETQVLEVSERALRQLGVSLGGQRGVVKYEVGTVSAPGFLLILQEGANFTRQLLGQLQGLVEKGEAKVLANPKVASVSGKKATIEVVQELYFRTAPFLGPTPTPQPTPIVPFFQLQAISAGVKLEITPMVGAEGDILLEISPEVSSVVGLTPEGLPQLSTRKVTATVWVREGQTVLLGGLRQKEEVRTTVKTPLLSEIPILGELFKSSRKEVRENELVILLTPTLVKPSPKG